MIKISYILLFIVLWTVILIIYNTALKKVAIDQKSRFKKLLIPTVVLLSWLAIQFIISTSGFYHDLSLPPRIPLFMILPLFLFTIIFLRYKKDDQLLQVIPLYVPIAYQSFRAIIEPIFYFTHLEGILPIQVTFEGSNYDIF